MKKCYQLAVMLFSGVCAITLASETKMTVITLPSSETKITSVSLVRDLAVACADKTGPGGEFCAGYVSGVLDVMVINGAPSTLKPLGFRATFGVCPTKKITYEVAIQVFQDWAAAHPENGRLGKEAVTLALQDQWPCDEEAPATK